VRPSVALESRSLAIRYTLLTDRNVKIKEFYIHLYIDFLTLKASTSKMWHCLARFGLLTKITKETKAFESVEIISINISHLF
jgi:hypothetical protein